MSVSRSAANVIPPVRFLHVLLAVGFPLRRIIAVLRLPQAWEHLRFLRMYVIVVAIKLLLGRPPKHVISADLNGTLERPVLPFEMLVQVAGPIILFAALLTRLRTRGLFVFLARGRSNVERRGMRQMVGRIMPPLSL